MLIRELAIRNFRNIRQIHIPLAPGCNWLFGDNGAGKTAILEAVDILSRGRTFRTHTISPLIRYDEKEYHVRAALEQGRTVEVRKSLQKTQITIDGDKVNRRREAAELLPVQIMHPDSHALIQGGAKPQQAFIDWALFHMKQAAGGCWLAYRRALQQRNQLLKQQTPAAKMGDWNKALAEYGEQLHTERKQHLAELAEKLMAVDCFPRKVGTVEIQYARGWPEDQTLSEALENHYAEDNERGYTRFGPHRATLKWLVEGLDAGKHASRGQQKLLIATALLAQTALFIDQTGKECLFIIDDLAAELDETNQQALVSQIREMKMQALISMTKSPNGISNSAEHRMFHVKHGEIVV